MSPRPVLVIGNKTYSSWSFRPWLALTQAGIDFEEVVIPLDLADTQARIREYSHAGRVPILIDGDVTIWESVAILEYAHERWPDAALWPEDPQVRGVARAVSAEMHAGFQALRSGCPMNMRRVNPPRDRGAAVDADVARVTEIWRDCRARHGVGGPFLFGRFSNADAMYAPVVSRFVTYSIEVDPVSRAYMDAIQALGAYRAWKDDAAEEPWTIDREEVA